MLEAIKESILTPLLHLVYPHLCSGCGSDLLKNDSYICYKCYRDLPETGFASLQNNPVEQKFWGRVNVNAAMAQVYFVKDSLVQEIIHDLKYKNNRRLGVYLGKMMGATLMESKRFEQIDAVIPLPLHKKKQKERGYNQAELLASGIAEIMKVPLLSGNVVRIEKTETQTKKQRIERWENVAGKFMIKDDSTLENKHLLLVDDVLTTGATLESCIMELLKIDNVLVSVAVFATV